MSEPNCWSQNVNNEAASVIGCLIPRELLRAHPAVGAGVGRAGNGDAQIGEWHGFGEVALEEESERL